MTRGMMKTTVADTKTARHGLTNKMMIVLDRRGGNAPDVPPATLAAMERRGLIKFNARGGWRWTQLAHNVRRPVHGSEIAEASEAERQKEKVKRAKDHPKKAKPDA